MSAEGAAKAFFFALGGGSALAALDLVPLLTIAVAVFCSIVSGVMAYRFANKEAQKRIKESFENHMHFYHEGHEDLKRKVEERKNVLR